ncbi:MAG: LAGLIDADG family homing endonuclease [Candidatus Caldarchaeales archaeon]
MNSENKLFSRSSLEDQLRVYRYVMEKKTESAKNLAQQIREKFHVSIHPDTIKRWKKRGSRFDFLIDYLETPILEISYFTLRDEAIKLHNVFGYVLISKILHMKYGIRISPPTINGWLRGKKPRTTNLSPSPELAVVAAAVVGDGCITTSKHLRPKPYVQKKIELSMKDIEPVLMVRDCLLKICKYNYIISEKQGRYWIACHRKDLVDYLSNRDNILNLLRSFPIEFMRMLFECDGHVSASISTVNDKGKIKKVFDVKICLTNSDKELLEEVQKQLEKLGIRSKIYLSTKAGTPLIMPNNSRIYIRKKDIYRLSIQEKLSIMKFSTINFITRRKRQKLENIINILQKCSETEAVDEWIKLVAEYMKGE